MNVNKIMSIYGITVVIILLSTLSPTVVNAEVVIVVGANSKLNTASTSEISRLWLGKSDQIAGVSVKPIELKVTGSAGDEFYEKFLGKSSKQIKKYFIKEALKGGVTAPQKFSDIERLIKELSSNTSTFSYLDKAEFDKHGAELIKILKIKD